MSAATSITQKQSISVVRLELQINTNQRVQRVDVTLIGLVVATQQESGLL
jgi:hypothetical protein